jgi:hypothetical protein
MPVGERLYCQVDPFILLEIVVIVEGLQILVILEWPVVLFYYIRVKIYW